MNRVHFITESNNAEKFTGVKRALEQIPQTDFFFSGILSKSENTKKPVSINETHAAAMEKVLNLFPLYKCTAFDKNVYGIGIQKGITMLDEEEPLSLICVVLVANKDCSKIIHANHKIQLAESVREHFKKSEEKDIYKSLGWVYGRDVMDKTISLYKKLTDKSEGTLFEETVLKALSF